MAVYNFTHFLHFYKKALLVQVLSLKSKTLEAKTLETKLQFIFISSYAADLPLMKGRRRQDVRQGADLDYHLR